MSKGNNEKDLKSIPEWETLEEFIRGHVQKLIQGVLALEVLALRKKYDAVIRPEEQAPTR